MNQFEKIEGIPSLEVTKARIEENLKFIVPRLSSLFLKPEELEYFESNLGSVRNFLGSQEYIKGLNQFAENRLLLIGSVRKLVEIVNDAFTKKSKAENDHEHLTRDELLVENAKKQLQDILQMIGAIKES